MFSYPYFADPCFAAFSVCSLKFVHGSIFLTRPDLTRPIPIAHPQTYTVGLKCGLNDHDSSLFRKRFSNALAVAIANQRMLMNEVHGVGLMNEWDLLSIPYVNDSEHEQLALLTRYWLRSSSSVDRLLQLLQLMMYFCIKCMFICYYRWCVAAGWSKSCPAL